MGWFDSKKVKYLKKLKAGDKITINTPSGFCHTKDDTKLYKQPTIVSIVNNDTDKHTLWIQLKTTNSTIYDFTLNYYAEELENYILFNIINKKEETKKETPKTKKELELELKNAISNDNFETANIINEKIKKLE